MTDLESRYLDATEVHSVAEIIAVLDDGLPIDASIKGLTLFETLLEMYYRSSDFALCLKVLLDRGAPVSDPKLLPVLLDDPRAMINIATADPTFLSHRVNIRTTFTPLVGATLLHVAAEYLCLNAAKTLIGLGADVNARADFDAFGMNGHTPIFHTVNSNRDRASAIMKLFLESGADPTIKLGGITWGKGFDWETTFFDVTPVSYAQLGLMPQVHRTESDIYENIALLLKAAGRPVPPLMNIPNKYLQPPSRNETTSPDA